MLRAVVIDDIDELRTRFIKLLSESAYNIELVGEADNLIEGIKLIKKTQPDIVFLDIEMPNHSGLEILDFFADNEINFHLVFVTAHAHYAINAFELSATDYILKPVTPDSVKKTIEKINKSASKTPYNVLKGNLEKKSKIVINTANTISVVAYEEILFLKAERAYTSFKLKTGETIIAAKPLVEYEEILPQKQFFRSHRSYLVNIGNIKEIDKKNFTIMLSNGDEVPLAENKKGILLNLLE